MYVVGAQKTRLRETVLFSTKNEGLKLSIRKYSQFYAEMFCFSGSMCITIVLQSMVTSFASNKRNCKSHCRPNAK